MCQDNDLRVHPSHKTRFTYANAVINRSKNILMCRTRYLIFTMVLKARNGLIIQGQPVGRYEKNARWIKSPEKMAWFDSYVASSSLSVGYFMNFLFILYKNKGKIPISLLNFAFGNINNSYKFLKHKILINEYKKLCEACSIQNQDKPWALNFTCRNCRRYLKSNQVSVRTILHMYAY